MAPVHGGPAPIDGLVESADAVAGVVGRIPPRSIGAPTPCTEMDVGVLLDHLAVAVTVLDAGARGRGMQASFVTRAEVADAIRACARAWLAPRATDGRTTVGGETHPLEFHRNILRQELLLHGWDLAVATGQEPPVVRSSEIRLLYDFLREVRSAEPDSDGAFGPPLADVPGAPDVPGVPDVPVLNRTLRLSGRDPDWKP